MSILGKLWLLEISFRQYRGELDKAMAVTERALKCLKQGSAEYCLILAKRGFLGLLMGDTSNDRLRDLQAAWASANNMGHQAAEAKILGMLSIWYQETGDLKKAEEYLQEALGIQRELEDKESLAKLLVGLGTLYRARGNFQGSRGALEEAQSLTTDQRVGINSHLELGRLFHVQGKLVEARAEILLALNMTLHTEWVNERADCCRELARIAQESGNLAESMEFYRRAYALYEDYGYRAKAMATMEEMRAER